MKEKTKEWIEFASRDLSASERLKDDEYVTNVACFHAQQAVEKILKAVLEEKDISIPKIHDLIKLNNLAKPYIEVEKESLKKLNEIYIENRYPSDIGLLPTGFPTVEDADEIYNLAKEIFEKVVGFLKKIQNA